MVWSLVILVTCAFGVASAQFYLPTNKAQKYVRPRMDQSKPDQKRDSRSLSSSEFSPKDVQESMSQDHKDILRQLLATHNLQTDQQSSDGGYLDKKRHVMCYLLLQMFDEKVEHILAEEDIEKKQMSEEERQLVKQRADEAIAFINQHLAALDYCSQHFGQDDEHK